MKLSVVIPCHNRLYLLKGAIETIIRQPKGSWHIVVFDNASSDPIKDYIASLDNPSIVYDRSETFLPVTDSWNRAVSLFDGDYCVLLGDDDGLLPDTVERLFRIVEEHGHPDVVYGDIYQFWHAGVAPWRPAAHVVDVRHGFFFDGQALPFRLDEQQARRAVRGSLALRINYSFNSQAFFYKRSYVKELTRRGPFFRSPFPDYYIANVALAKSTSTIVSPIPLAVAGISKSSYGYTLYNNRVEEGDKLLNVDYQGDMVATEMTGQILPGSSYNTNFIIAMEHVARELADRAPVKADVARYRKMQLLTAMRDGTLRSDPRWRRSRISMGERIFLRGWKSALLASRFSPKLAARVEARLQGYLSLTQFPPRPTYSQDLDCGSAADLFDAFKAGRVL